MSDETEEEWCSKAMFTAKTLQNTHRLSTVCARTHTHATITRTTTTVTSRATLTFPAADAPLSSEKLQGDRGEDDALIREGHVHTRAHTYTLSPAVHVQQRVYSWNGSSVNN